MAKMERASYQRILKQYQARKKGNVRLTQSSLILIQTLTGDQKVYAFPVLQSDTQTATDPAEVRLNLNDEFVSYEVGYYLRATHRNSAGAVDAAMYLPYAPAELGAANYPLNGIWEARMSISVNNIKRLEKWDMLKHKCVPRTQFSNFSVGIPNATQPSVCYGESGTASMQPMLTFTGAKKNDIEVTMNTAVAPVAAVDWITVSGTVTQAINQVALIFRGMLAQNAAKFQ